MTCNGVRPLICRKATLAPGESASIRVRTRQNAVGQLENFAEVRADQPERNCSNNEDVAGIIVEPVRAAIRIRQAGRPQPRPRRRDRDLHEHDPLDRPLRGGPRPGLRMPQELSSPTVPHITFMG